MRGRSCPPGTAARASKLHSGGWIAHGSPVGTQHTELILSLVERVVQLLVPRVADPTAGRILGTVGKVGIAVVMWLVLSVAAFWV
jgi:hypothetical protein